MKLLLGLILSGYVLYVFSGPSGDRESYDSVTKGVDSPKWLSDKANVSEIGYSKFKSNFPLKTIRSLYLPSKNSKIAVVDGPYVVINSGYSYPSIRNNVNKKRILVTGGAGFVGSHLVDRLMLMGNDVTVIDNFFTGDRRNIEHWMGHPNFELIRHDVVDPFMMEVDQIYHLACPASPPHYQYNPVKTVKTSVMGTINMLGLAKRVNATILFTSTSGK